MYQSLVVIVLVSSTYAAILTNDGLVRWNVYLFFYFRFKSFMFRQQFQQFINIKIGF